MALGVEHPSLGEAVVLCVVPSRGASADEDEIRAFLRERLAAYKVPRKVLVFREEELSYTGNQKVQLEPLKQAVVERLEAGRVEIAGHRYGES